MLSADAAAQQSASSGIIGQVVDSTHAGVPGATVTATNVGTGAQRVALTDAEGRYSIPALPAATYRVRVELTGFRTSEIASLVLRSGETVRTDVTLTISTLAENVNVQGEAPLLSSASATVGATITEKMLEELPLAGRTLLNITALAPGVTPRDFQRQNLFYGRRDQYVTVEGGRDSSTNYAIDGVYVRTLRWNNMSLNPPVDTVQEVNLLRNAFSTEYGQGQAVVSMVTKSGTNRSSFSAYEYFRDDALEAKNYFAVSKTPHERNQFGGTFGGPLLRNKLFLFTGYEGSAPDEGRGPVREPAESGVADRRFLRRRDAHPRPAHRAAVLRRTAFRSRGSRRSPRSSSRPSRRRIRPAPTTTARSATSPTTRTRGRRAWITC